MTLSVEQYRYNVKWLEDRAKDYPFSCRTKGNYPDPRIVGARLRNNYFVTAPLGKEREWRFKTPEDMSRFKYFFTTLDNKI